MTSVEDPRDAKRARKHVICEVKEMVLNSSIRLSSCSCNFYLSVVEYLLKLHVKNSGSSER